MKHTLSDSNNDPHLGHLPGPESGSLLADLQGLRARGLRFTDCVQVFGEARQACPEGLAASLAYGVAGEVEFDDQLIVSRSPGGGAYVMAWVWVGPWVDPSDARA